MSSWCRRLQRVYEQDTEPIRFLSKELWVWWVIYAAGISKWICRPSHYHRFHSPGIEVHVVHKHRSGYAVKVSRIYRNRVYHTEELVSSRDIIDVDFIVPTSPNTVNKQLLSCRCPLLRANHTYALFGYVKSRQSKHFLLTLNVVLEIPHDSMNRRQMRRALKKLAATNCPGSSSTPTVVTATEPGHRLETVVGHKSSPRQKYIIHHS